MESPTFIVAEDDRFMREWLELSLGTLGARVVQAANGHELATLVEAAGPVHLVVSDLRMPGPSGLEILARMRAAGSRVPFLLITAYGSAEVVGAARTLGASVLYKPFTRRDLVDRVRAVCGLTAGGGLPGAHTR